jgi:hypothetical protein
MVVVLRPALWWFFPEILVLGVEPAGIVGEMDRPRLFCLTLKHAELVMVWGGYFEVSIW